ncbi:MAG: carboxypeptidase regulatory-like domain-containing protein, partial [Gemmatimonadetes bacterium]|nr:carboxypeptidase regulatory-like domain-containing protein [Gemmatimonadota bacterium]
MKEQNSRTRSRGGARVRRPLPREAAHSVVLAAAALLAAAGTALGQQVAGRLVSVDGTPVPWALVRLVDEAGEDVASDVTSSSGTFLVFAPEPGIYRVRTERIGFHSALSDDLDLARDERYSVNLTASDAPIELTALDVRSSAGSCGLRPEEGSDLLALWNEIEKALELQTATEGSGQYAFDLEVYEYVANRDGRPADPRKAEQGTRELVLQGFSAFRAADPELLVERGFHWDDGAFYAPDARTLLSDAFQRTHCYRAREKDGRLGVEFKPESTRGVIEVKGTLWLDESGKLNTLEYEYVSGDFVKPAVDGGYIEFEQLPEGAWIVRRWYIRAPAEYHGLANYFLEAGGRIVEVERVGSQEPLVAQALEQFSEQLEESPPAAPLELPGEVAAGLSLFRYPPDSAKVAGVLARNPDFASSAVGEAAAARAGLWRRAGQPSLALLELTASSPVDPRRGLVEVERARILFAEGRSVEAAAAFRSACATGESLALEALWTDLRSLATSAEFADWRMRPAESRCALLGEMVAERAWRAGLRVRDRLALHYERLELARTEWRLPAPRDRGGTVDQFGWRPELEFDDRGLLYVRMGRPDQVDRAVAGRDSTTGNWVDAWQYDRPERPRTFFFVSPMRAEAGGTGVRLAAEPWRAATGQYASDQMDVVTDMAVE